MNKLFVMLFSVLLALLPATAQNGPEPGSPTVTAKRYTVIRLNYAYAPGLAVCLGGQGLMYGQMDPWAGGFGNGFGNNNRGGGFSNGSFGGNRGGFGSDNDRGNRRGGFQGRNGSRGPGRTSRGGGDGFGRGMN